MEKTLSLYKELLFLSLDIIKYSEIISKLSTSQKYKEATDIDKKRKILYYRVQELQIEINSLANFDNGESVINRSLENLDFAESFKNIDHTTILKLKEQLIKLESIDVKSEDALKQIEILKYLIE